MSVGAREGPCPRASAHGSNPLLLPLVFTVPLVRAVFYRKKEIPECQSRGTLGGCLLQFFHFKGKERPTRLQGEERTYSEQHGSNGRAALEPESQTAGLSAAQDGAGEGVGHGCGHT